MTNYLLSPDNIKLPGIQFFEAFIQVSQGLLQESPTITANIAIGHKPGIQDKDWPHFRAGQTGMDQSGVIV